MRSSIASGSSELAAETGASSSTSSPPVRRWLFARGDPSTITAPASTSRSAAARDPTSGSVARKRSSRSPAASSGTRRRSVADAPGAARLAVRGDERREQDRDAHDDEAVREVERGPEAQVEEVGHVPEPHAVDQVREAAADHEAERDGQERVPSAGAREEREHPRDGEAGQDDHDRRRAREEPERDPGVLNVVDRERAEYAGVLVEGKPARDEVLRELV